MTICTEEFWKPGPWSMRPFTDTGHSIPKVGILAVSCPWYWPDWPTAAPLHELAINTSALWLLHKQVITRSPSTSSSGRLTGALYERMSGMVHIPRYIKVEVTGCIGILAATFDCRLRPRHTEVCQERGLPPTLTALRIQESCPLMNGE